MRILIFNAVCIAALCGLTSGSWAQTPMDFGKAEYDSSCASCHGAGGKGDGPMRASLKQAPSDLTTLAKRHGGALPVQYLWSVIDGRAATPVVHHGTREMPIWGERFGAPALADPDWAGQAQWYTRGRIVALIDYLQRIQQK